MADTGDYEGVVEIKDSANKIRMQWWSGDDDVEEVANSIVERINQHDQLKSCVEGMRAVLVEVRDNVREDSPAMWGRVDDAIGMCPAPPTTCGTCKGEKTVPEFMPDIFEPRIDCRDCGGTGKVGQPPPLGGEQPVVRQPIEGWLTVPTGHFWRGTVDPFICRNCGELHSAHIHTDEMSRCPDVKLGGGQS